LAEKNRERLRAALKAPWGTIIVTGPTGCGKTTTLYACLDDVSSPQVKVMTVEDPVEYLLPWAVQVAVRPSDGVTFATAIRSILRSDPDVILVGELRDEAALHAVHQAALTGHLVFTTLHALDTVGALRRMADMGAQPFVVSEATRLILAQRLVRVVCRDCSVETEPATHLLDAAADIARSGGLAWDELPHSFRQPVGCGTCGQSGYRTRVLITEVLAITPEIAAALGDQASDDELRAVAIGQGMVTLAADGVRLAANGTTTLEEVLRVIGLGG